MAAGYLAGPGSAAGPCLAECRHTDCAATRAMAAAACYICGEAIGYNIGFYNDPERGLVHRLCYLRSIEKGGQEHGEEANREPQEEGAG